MHVYIFFGKTVLFLKLWDSTGILYNVQKLLEILVFRVNFEWKKKYVNIPHHKPEKNVSIPVNLSEGKLIMCKWNLLRHFPFYLSRQHYLLSNLRKKSVSFPVNVSKWNIDHAWMKLSWRFSFFSILIALLSRIFLFLLKIVRICFTNTLRPILDIPNIWIFLNNQFLL